MLGNTLDNNHEKNIVKSLYENVFVNVIEKWIAGSQIKSNTEMKLYLICY